MEWRPGSNLDYQLLVASRKSRATKLLMTIPGVGAVTAVSYIAAIEDPENFPTSRSVGAWLGLTTRRYQSGEIDYDGHISRRGDDRLRGLLYEAATRCPTLPPRKGLSGIHHKCRNLTIVMLSSHAFVLGGPYGKEAHGYSCG